MGRGAVSGGTRGDVVEGVRRGAAGASGRAPPRLWTLAQLVGLAAIGALLAGLWRRPETTLDLLWNAVVPLLPASFLIAPGVWRNICPLASLGMACSHSAPERGRTDGRARGRAGGRSIAPSGWLGAAGIWLLFLFVPARRFLFNTHGAALAVTIAVFAAAALIAGRWFDHKAGFCNSLCPVLPVERLYGQGPLLRIGNPRCPSCTRCTHRGCLDLAPERSLARAMEGGAGEAASWLGTSYGAFAAMFPGFVVGYYTMTDVGPASAGWVYFHVAAWAAASYALTVVIVIALDAGARVATAALGTIAAGLYYWFAAPLLAGAYGAGSAGTWAIRGGALALVTFWGWCALRRARKGECPLRRRPGWPPELEFWNEVRPHA